MIKLPDELEAILLQASVQVDMGYWTIGDITADLVDELVPGSATKAEVRGYVANRARLATETVRDLERMSRKIPAEKRTYNLSRHQYRACLNAGDKWEEYAQRAEESSADYGGAPTPVSVIWEWVRQNKDEEPTWTRTLAKIVRLARTLVDNKDTPPDIQDWAFQVIDYFANQADV